MTQQGRKFILITSPLVLFCCILFSCAINDESSNKTSFIKEKDLTVSKLVSDALNSMRESKPKIAVNLLEEALEKEPDSKTIKENLALAYLQINEMDKAKAVYLELQGIDPANSTYPLALGDIEYTNVNYNEAHEFYLKAKILDDALTVKDEKRTKLIAQRISDVESKINSILTGTPTPTATAPKAWILVPNLFEMTTASIIAELPIFLSSIALEGKFV